MARVETTTPQGLPDVETGRRLFHTMALIRRFEERTEEQYTRARIGGYCHLAIGEEAATVGAIDVLEDGDCLFASYRDHGTALAVGSEPAAVMAELFGKETGVAHGRGGSMHLLDTGRRFFGGWGIVGGHLPIAVGAGLALDQTGQQNAVLCQFGEGASNTGAFHEALNLAAVWELPVVFQVINNQYGMGTSVDQASAEPEIYKRGAAYRMHGERVDGNDVLAVQAVTIEALERARSGNGPTLIEAYTYRMGAHTTSDDPTRYRLASELEEWKLRDPIARLKAYLSRSGIADHAFFDAVDAEGDELAARIRSGTLEMVDPPATSMFDHVYAEQTPPLAAQRAEFVAYHESFEGGEDR